MTRTKSNTRENIKAVVFLLVMLAIFIVGVMLIVAYFKEGDFVGHRVNPVLALLGGGALAAFGSGVGIIFGIKLYTGETD